MESLVARDLRLVYPPPRERRKAVPNEVLGITIFILTELMLFAGFISAFTISKAAAPMWPPAGQPRLPLEETAINTIALLLSGALVWWAGRIFDRVGPRSARVPLATAIACGAFFLLFQGFEWVSMINEGLTLTSSTHGAFFYLIVGAHGLHAVGGLMTLVVLFSSLWREKLLSDVFWAGRLFWYFVVLLWPVLYGLVYR